MTALTPERIRAAYDFAALVLDRYPDCPAAANAFSEMQKLVDELAAKESLVEKARRIARERRAA